MRILFEFPYVVTSPNIGLRAHWSANHTRTKDMRIAVRACLSTFEAHKPDLAAGAVTVEMQRISPRPFDGHDNAKFALKPAGDEIAAWFGVPDNDPRLTWEYPPHERRAPREHVVRVQIIQQGGDELPLKVFSAEELAALVAVEEELAKAAKVPAPAPPAKTLAQLCRGSRALVISGDGSYEPVVCAICKATVATRLERGSRVIVPHAGPSTVTAPVVTSSRPTSSSEEADAPIVCKSCGTEIIWGAAAMKKDRDAGVCPTGCKKPPAVKLYGDPGAGARPGESGGKPKPSYAALPWEQDPTTPDEWVTRDVMDVARTISFRREMDVVDPDRRVRVLVRHDYGDHYLYFEVNPPAPFVQRRDGSPVLQRR